MDRVVSSYTPTVRALGYVRERNGAPTNNQRAAIVSMSTTPDEVPLQHAAEEAKRVQAKLAGVTTVLDDRPTRADVLDRLGDCAIAHFACHSFSDPQDPSRSRLLLLDHAERPSTVSRLAPIQFDTRHSARVLHQVVRTFRDELLRTPSLWAGYLHAGA